AVAAKANTITPLDKMPPRMDQRFFFFHTSLQMSTTVTAVVSPCTLITPICTAPSVLMTFSRSLICFPPEGDRPRHREEGHLDKHFRPDAADRPCSYRILAHTSFPPSSFPPSSRG